MARPGRSILSDGKASSLMSMIRSYSGILIISAFVIFLALFIRNRVKRDRNWLVIIGLVIPTLMLIWFLWGMYALSKSSFTF